MSIEQFQHFHQVRRILKAVAPEYRLIADTNLEPGQTVLDVRTHYKTLAIGEETEIMTAVATLLFQVGHLLLLKDPAFALLFGQNMHDWTATEIELVDHLADLGCRADLAAGKWAVHILQSYWPVKSPDAATRLIDPLLWSREEWVEYFSR